MILCSCDPDCKTPAFAVFRDVKLVKWVLLKTGRRGRIDRIMPDIKGIIDTWRPALLVIENQYLPGGPEAARRFKAVSQLVAARATIAAVFAMSNIGHRLIEPFAWQRSLGGAELGRDQLKRRSILKAGDIAGARIDNHNVADAINIGYWFVSRNRLTRSIGEAVRK